MRQFVVGSRRVVSVFIYSGHVQFKFLLTAVCSSREFATYRLSRRVDVVDVNWTLTLLELDHLNSFLSTNQYRSFRYASSCLCNQFPDVLYQFHSNQSSSESTSHATNRIIILPRDAMLARCVLSVRHKPVWYIETTGKNRSGFCRESSFHLLTLCYKKIRVSPKIMVYFSGTLSQTLDTEKFRPKSTVLSFQL